MSEIVTVIGGGLAGSEAAWQIAERGLTVNLFEMRPKVKTGAHETSDLGESKRGEKKCRKRRKETRSR